MAVVIPSSSAELTPLWMT